MLKFLFAQWTCLCFEEKCSFSHTINFQQAQLKIFFHHHKYTTKDMALKWNEESSAVFFKAILVIREKIVCFKEGKKLFSDNGLHCFRYE